MKNVIAARADYTPSLVINKIYKPISLSQSESSFSVVNSGTAAAPCRLSFTPINDVMSMTITGLSEEPIKMVKIQRGENVVIDGINKKIEINGANGFSRYDGWEFPKVQPGENIINMTSANQMSLIELEFQPRYI